MTNWNEHTTCTKRGSVTTGLQDTPGVSFFSRKVKISAQSYLIVGGGDGVQLVENDKDCKLITVLVTLAHNPCRASPLMTMRNLIAIALIISENTIVTTTCWNRPARPDLIGYPNFDICNLIAVGPEAWPQGTWKSRRLISLRLHTLRDPALLGFFSFGFECPCPQWIHGLYSLGASWWYVSLIHRMSCSRGRRSNISTRRLGQEWSQWWGWCHCWSRILWYSFDSPASQESDPVPRSK